MSSFQYFFCFFFLLLIAGDVTCRQNSKVNFQMENSETKDSQRDGKFFSLFTLVRFPNDACSASGGDNGTCYTSAECSSNGGTSTGTCASGFGVCCVFTGNCGGSTSQNCTYFENPGYSSTFNQVQNCQFTVNKCANNICQLRLDFEQLTLVSPDNPTTLATTNTAGQCLNDRFTVSGGTANTLGPICGVNTNQHMIMDVGRSSNPCTLSVTTDSTSFARTWRIKISQIECSSDSLAPSGCQQYYVGLTGTIYSYNFDTNNAAGSQHLANQNYGICIRMDSGYCSVRYTVNNNQPFSLSDAGTAGISAVCTTDFVIIPNGIAPGAPSADRYCGNAFPANVDSTSKPFLMTFISDASEAASPAETGRNGFCLNYEQMPC